MSNTFSEGDFVEAVKSKDKSFTLMRGLLGSSKMFGLVLRAQPYGPSMKWLEEEGFTLTLLEKAAPVLPTKPGLYLSAMKSICPQVFHLNDSGHWYLLNTNSHFPISDGHLERHIPFIPLEPVAATGALEQANAKIEAALKVTDDMRSGGWHLGKTVSETGQKIYEILSGTTNDEGAEDE